MHVAVGSTNPVKIAATRDALERFGPTITSLSVDSGVSEQPRSIAETIQGAENRARRALEEMDGNGSDDTASTQDTQTYGVGIEGGVTALEAVPGLFLIMWAAVTDGERIGRGGGPTLRLPDPVAERIESGEELGPVMDDVCGTTGVAENEGAAGVLTDGLTSRQGALEEAVACAFGPFVTHQYGDE